MEPSGQMIYVRHGRCGADSIALRGGFACLGDPKVSQQDSPGS